MLVITLQKNGENVPVPRAGDILFRSGVKFKRPGGVSLFMRETADNGLRIIAVYERKACRETVDSDAVTYCDESLRVDGKGLIPRASPDHTVQVNLEDDPRDYSFPVPADFNRRGYFVIKATELPFGIPYGRNAVVIVMEKNKRGDRILAKTPLRYRIL